MASFQINRRSKSYARYPCLLAMGGCFLILTDILLKLYLAAPTEYPCGTPLPFFLKLSAPITPLLDSTSQLHAVDILSTGESLSATLQQVFREAANPSTISCEIASAVMWKLRDSDSLSEESYVRLLQGEMSLSPHFIASFDFPSLVLKASTVKYLSSLW